MDAGEEELNEIEIADPERDAAQGGEPNDDQLPHQDAPQVITTVMVPYHIYILYRTVQSIVLYIVSYCTYYCIHRDNETIL
jgi:hypothetical protein